MDGGGLHGFLDIHAADGPAHTCIDDLVRTVVFEQCSKKYQLCLRLPDQKIHDKHGDMEVCARVYSEGCGSSADSLFCSFLSS